jgi:hypothetical protein
MKRGEAVNLLADISLKEKLVQPSLVSLDRRDNNSYNSYQLKIKGDYDFELLKMYAESKNFTVEEDKAKRFLIIY